MARIYTRSGDKGNTSLTYGVRVLKNDIRVEAYGTCDEANSTIGFVSSLLVDENFNNKDRILDTFHKIQTHLFHVGSYLSTPEGKEVYWDLDEGKVTELEQEIDWMEMALPPLKTFILPGGHPAASALHVARTIVRRAERCAVTIERINPLVLAYLNRLSDYLFVAARFINQSFQIKEQNLHE